MTSNIELFTLHRIIVARTTDLLQNEHVQDEAFILGCLLTTFPLGILGCSAMLAEVGNARIVDSICACARCEKPPHGAVLCVRILNDVVHARAAAGHECNDPV